MAGKPRALCAIVPEHVWAMARMDYEGGMTARAVCDRYGVRESGLRGRALREGWVKSGVKPAAALFKAEDRAAPVPAAAVATAPTAPGEIARGALARASEALLAGRPAEAVAIVRALDDVLPLAEGFGVDYTPADFDSGVRYAAKILVEQMLGDGEVARAYASFAFGWRAAHLGEAAAERDRAYAARKGWTEALYDDQGRLREPWGET